MIDIVHVFLLTELLPDRYPKFLDWMRSREYSYQGSMGRTGIQHPFVREIKLFDVNVFESCMEPFLGEMKNFLYEGIRKNEEPGIDMKGAHFTKSKIDFAKAILSAVTPLKQVNMDKIKAVPIGNLPVDGPAYAHVLGYLKDPVEKMSGKELM